MTIPSHDELDRDLRRLAEEQEKLAAELAKTSATEVRSRNEAVMYVPVKVFPCHLHREALYVYTCP